MSGARLSAAVASVAIGLTATGCAPSAQERAKRDLAVVREETTPARLETRGEAAAVGGDLTRAEQYFVAAIRAGGDERKLTKNLMAVCAADARYSSAATYGEEYLRKHPNDTEVRYVVATLYVGLGDVPRAHTALQRVVDEKPEIAEAHYALASILRQEGEALLDADREFREYIRLSPDGRYAESARASLLKSVR